MQALIDRPDAFARLLEQLKRQPLVAVDTEAASFHRHHDRIYLLQLSDRSETWLVDPLALGGLPGLGEFLSDPGIEFVFHDADYDLRLLAHQFGYRAARLFDTRVAAQFLAEPGVGLAALLEKYFGVRLDKRFQRADWSLRPLSEAMLQYAATDTRYLPALRDELFRQLAERNRLSWVEEECKLIAQVRWADPDPPEIEAFGVKGVRPLDPRSLAVFRELYVWRTKTAETLDRAAFRIAGNEALLLLALHPPGDLQQLARTRGIGRELVQKHGQEILAAIRRGSSIPEAELPRIPRASRQRPDAAYDHRLEQLKRVRSTLSERYALMPGVLAPNWLLEAVARAAPKTVEDLAAIAGIRTWQVREFGKDLVL